MLIDFVENGLYDRFVMTSDSGIRNLIFMTGWICSVLGLYKIHQPTITKGQKIIFIIQLMLLVLANLWNVCEIINPLSTSPIVFLLNFTWPLGGFFMIVTGIVVIRAKKMKDWKKYAALLAGFWFPQTFLIYWFTRETLAELLASGIYAAISFGLLGFALVVSSEGVPTRRAIA
jgi:hypothetical protein